jgi:hypothetical protein
MKYMYREMSLVTCRSYNQAKEEGNTSYEAERRRRHVKAKGKRLPISEICIITIALLEETRL